MPYYDILRMDYMYFKIFHDILYLCGFYLAHTFNFQFFKLEILSDAKRVIDENRI